MGNGNPAPASETCGATSSRRHAFALMLGGLRWLPRPLEATNAHRLVLRLAISESLVADVNLNDARAAMRIWVDRMMLDSNIVIELNARVFETTEEIVRRARSGQLDSVALNVVEYRQIADVLDPSHITASAGSAALEQYVLLTKRNGEFRQLNSLRGRRLNVLKAPRMCVAPAWLSTLLDEAHCGPAEQFFGSVTTDTKASRVVLPVFLGGADACLTSKRGFETMCELNPQVAKDLTAIASSPAMVVSFYSFHKNYHDESRERFAKIYSDLSTSVSGRQLATLFQFDELKIRDVGCLASALGILETAERVRSKPGAGGRKGP